MPRYLQEFVQRNPHRFSKDQKKYLKQGFTNTYPGKSHPQLLKAWKKGEPCVILTGSDSEKHAISVVLSGDILTVSNRGFGNREEATQMFKVPESCKTLAFVQQLCSHHSSTIDGFYKSLREIPNLQMIDAIQHKKQKVGNCTTAGLKAAIHVLFFLCKGKNKQEAREIYKEFTAFLRVRSLEEYKAQVPIQNEALLQQIEEKAAKKEIDITSTAPDPGKTKSIRRRFFGLYLQISSWLASFLS